MESKPTSQTLLHLHHEVRPKILKTRIPLGMNTQEKYIIKMIKFSRCCGPEADSDVSSVNSMPRRCATYETIQHGES